MIRTTDGRVYRRTATLEGAGPIGHGQLGLLDNLDGASCVVSGGVNCDIWRAAAAGPERLTSMTT